MILKTLPVLTKQCGTVIDLITQVCIYFLSNGHNPAALTRRLRKEGKTTEGNIWTSLALTSTSPVLLFITTWGSRFVSYSDALLFIGQTILSHVRMVAIPSCFYLLHPTCTQHVCSTPPPWLLVEVSWLPQSTPN